MTRACRQADLARRGSTRLPPRSLTDASVGGPVIPGPATLEAHLLDFEGDLYGARVRLEFHGRVRGELRFDGAEALVARIRQDVAEARALLSAAGDERV